MRTCLVVLLSWFAVCACNNNKKSGSELPEEQKGFLDKYTELKLPFSVADSSLESLSDSVSISMGEFIKYVPDSIFNIPFGKERRLSLSALGKVRVANRETYFVTLARRNNTRAVYLCVYDSNRYTAGMPLIVSDNDNIVNTASLDKKLSITLNKQWTIKDALYYRRIIYAYNNVGLFSTVLTETNEQQSQMAGLVNPLDTFPRTYKYSGDYDKGSKNLVAIRDGEAPDEYMFFVHFENESGKESCGGELKGTFRMVSDKQGVYNNEGDPCVLDLTFTEKTVKVKETGSCGNYRGIKCFFNDTFTKRKVGNSSPKKK